MKFGLHQRLHRKQNGPVYIIEQVECREKSQSSTGVEFGLRHRKANITWRGNTLGNELDLEKNSLSPQQPQQSPTEQQSAQRIRQRGVSRAETMRQKPRLRRVMPHDSCAAGARNPKAVARPIYK